MVLDLHIVQFVDDDCEIVGSRIAGRSLCNVNRADSPIIILALPSKTLTQGQLYDTAGNVFQRLPAHDCGGWVGGHRRIYIPCGTHRAQPHDPVQIRHRAGGRETILAPDIRLPYDTDDRSLGLSPSVVT